MHDLSIEAVGKALGAKPEALLPDALEQLQSTTLISHPDIDAVVQVILDRLCLSVSVARPVGLATWAEREAKRFGPAGVLEIAGAAAHAIALAARRYSIDHGRLLASLELLRGEIDRAVTPLRDESAVAAQASESLEAALTMLGERDRMTCEHSKATGEWARRLSRAMGLSAEEAAFVEVCAIVHDIGKIGTPDEILLKPSPLTPDEWKIMREHSAAGERILERISSLARCAPVVRAHHERYDGCGYPDGIAGIDIPFEARLVAVADAFHSMISDRPYRKAIAPRAALEILSGGRGTQWDPDAVDAMLGLFYRSAEQRLRNRSSA